MKKFTLCLMCFLIISCFPVLGLSQNALDIMLSPSDFAVDPGSWNLETTEESVPQKKLLCGRPAAKDTAADRPAQLTFSAPEEGVYRFWIYSRDYDSYPGTRHFEVDLNGKRYSHRFGIHGFNGWKWEGGFAVKLRKGANTVKLYDTSSAYSRFGGLLFTKSEQRPTLDTGEALDALYAKASTEVREAEEVSADVQEPRADHQIGIVIDEVDLEFEIAPMEADGHILAQASVVAEKIGATLTQQENKFTITWNDREFCATIGNKSATMGLLTTLLETPPLMENGQIMMPVSILKDLTGGDVAWNESARKVNISIPYYEVVEEEAIESNDFYIPAEGFEEWGTWTMDAQDGAFTGVALRGLTDRDADKEPAPATVTVNIPFQGKYNVWVHARDYQTNQPGSRYFSVQVNGKDAAAEFGKHGEEGFRWQKVGTYDFETGDNTVSLIDKSKFYARCDGVYITPDLHKTPVEEYQAVRKEANYYISEKKTIIKPSEISWNAEGGELKDQIAIENENVKVVFYNTDQEDGNKVRKNTYLKQNGEWICVDADQNSLVYLILYADRSKGSYTYNAFEFFPFFDQIVDGKGFSTNNVYESGLSHWAIPTGMQKLSENSVLLTADTPNASLDIIWELSSKEFEPKVTLSMKTKKAGAYSIGIFNTPEYTESSYEYGLLPFVISSKILPEFPALISSHYAFTPMSTMTFPASKSPLMGEKITRGVAVDPDSIPTGEWVYRDNARFGLGLRSYHGGVQPSIFAPLYSTESSNFKEGEYYSFTYRPIIYEGDWFDTFKHVTEDILKLKDYRENYYSSITEATFNIRSLLMDDYYSGWDDRDKQHYNMEGRNATSQANPLQALQTYLLTDDTKFLEERAIPTLAALLTRGNIHFYHGGSLEGSTSYFLTKYKEGVVSKIGEPIQGFNTSTFGAAYDFTFGMVPALQDIAVGNGVRMANAYGEIPTFSEKLWAYQYTGEEKYLEEAIQEADTYITTKVYAENNQLPGWTKFINITYYPHFQSLMDLYEVTKEQRFLDAAAYVAQRVTTCVWTSGMTDVKGEDTFLVEADAVRLRGFADSAQNFWWNGDRQIRLGSRPGVMGRSENDHILQDEEVPVWLPSRVGLGVEQASTFTESRNIIMSNWAPELLRLSYLTGEKYFETVARNAIIGRFANYPGYYLNRNMVHQMKADYPFTGPDYSSIYQHHIPTFMAMLDDYLISQTYAWSDGKIDFPYARSQGYAYFINRQYGFAPGRFFDQERVWLWMKEGIIDCENVNIDYVTARKNGVLCLALMNEAHDTQTAEISLGSEIPAGYTGSAELHLPNGEKTSIHIENGKFSLEIPAHKLYGVVIKIPGVGNPSYASLYDKEFKDNRGEFLECAFDFGKAMVLQMNNEKYYAYVYTTLTEPGGATLRYTVNGKDHVQTVKEYPFEFIIPVNSGDAFEFTIEANGRTASGVLRNMVK